MKKYYALYSKIKRRILAGEFEKSNKLPSKRVAADMENVSVVTIEKAYSLLEDEGYIKPCARRGYFVLPVSAPAPSAPEKTARPNPLPLPSLSVSHDFQYSLWIKSARKVLARHGGRLFVRAPAEGCEILRNAISEFLFEYRGFSAPPERIIIGSGAEQLYESVVKLLGRDKIYAVENPSYDKIRAVYSGTGARVNLMDAASEDSDTPVTFGKRVAVIGGGNTAMDSVRTARRLGAERAMIIYRRSEAEMPARLEEVKHAKEEGVEFITLHNPIEYIADEHGAVKQVVLQKMELGEPDASGRRSPVPIPGATVTIDIDMAIVSVGVSPNPIVPHSIPGLELGRKGTIAVDDDMQSSIPTIYAGGDIVRGGATVILAMGDGRRAAAAMHKQLSGK